MMSITPSVVTGPKPVFGGQQTALSFAAPIDWAERSDHIFDQIDSARARQENNADMLRMRQCRAWPHERGHRQFFQRV
jgi:hypothetical protein